VLRCWGLDGLAQLAQGTTSVTTPAAVGASQYTTVSTGVDHTCAIQTGSTLWCWGDNAQGQLGVSTPDGWTPTPTQVTGTNYTSVAAGALHSCATRSDGTLWCWGDNAYGQLGLGDTTDRSAPTQVGVATDWNMVVAGDRHTCGLRGGGSTAWCWGDGATGQLGQGVGVTSRTTPGQVGTDNDIFEISAGADHTCYLRDLDDGFCWGDNSYGQLGLGDTTTRWTPVTYTNDAGAIDAGADFTCEIDQFDELQCWGRNDRYQVGDGTTTTRLSPVQIDSGDEYTDVMTARTASCARNTSGALKCFGAATSGQTGTGSFAAAVTTPTQILTSIQSTGVATGGGGEHLCAIIGGTLLLNCWGAQLAGETGRTLRQTAPTTVTGGAVWRS
jgi:alpha-tubulin suppressor-like RCC1 family protein